MKNKITVLIAIVLLPHVAAYCWNTELTPEGWCRATCNLSKCTFQQCFEEPIPFNCGGGSGELDLTPPVMHVLSPVNKSYNTSTIPIEVTTEEQVESIRYATRGDQYSRLCSHCDHGERIIYRVNEGIHTWKFRAVDYAGNPVVEERTFAVDFTPPEIISVYPPNNFYVKRGNNNIRLEYSELNPRSIVFRHRQLGLNSWNDEEFKGCPPGEEQVCERQVTLNYPEKSKVEFKFVIQDNVFTTESDIYAVTVDTELMSRPIIVFSPTQGVHEDRQVEVHVEVIADECKEINMLLDDDRPKRLCSRCNSFQKTKTFTEGPHTLIIEAECSDVQQSEPVEFEIETKEPRIIRTEPGDEEYANGDFYIKYTEDNLKKVVLVYGNDRVGYRTVTSYSCSSGSSEECYFNSINLKAYDNETIFYYFNISDSLNTVSSDPVPVLVDATLPIITKTKPNDGLVSTERRVHFTLEVSEEVRSLEYKDQEMSRPKRLCSKCDSYDKDVSLKEGPHKITVIATDYAGNEGSLEFDVYTDTKEPKIYYSEPGYREDYSDGNTFTLTYMEENPVEMTLWVVEPGSIEGILAATKTDCPSLSRKGNCELEYDVSGYDGQVIEYWMTLEDIAGRIESTERRQVEVDAMEPVVTIHSPENKIYDSRYVLFNITVSEEVPYLKYNYDGKSDRTLCRNCDSYERKKAFSDGPHTLQIIAEDKAGNIGKAEAEFEVV